MTDFIKTAMLYEGISHIEDLPLPAFIHTIETLKDRIGTEKNDGYNYWFGLDSKGLYTSREGKSAKRSRFYTLEDLPTVANYNGFRGAFLAIKKEEKEIRKILEIGDVIEVEIMFGRQPNAIVYGSDDTNYIVFIRGIGNTSDEKVSKLEKHLENKKVKVKSIVVSSNDGDTLTKEDVEQTWQFTKVQTVDVHKIDTSLALSLLSKLKHFISLRNSVFQDKTNGQMAEVSLTTIPKNLRAKAKAERERINHYIMDNFKYPIKETLLNDFVRRIKPALQDKNLDPSEDIGIEGVVLSDPVTKTQVKIVDKDVFTAINFFNSSVKAVISGLVKTMDQDKPIELRGGAFGQAKIRIANVLGINDIALSSGARKFVSKFKGEDEEETAENIAKSIKISDLDGLKTKIEAILKNAINEVDGILHQFKEEAGEFKLQLKDGKTIGLSPEVMKRTFTAFAETKQNISEIIDKVYQSETGADLIMALYGKTIQSIFGSGDITEMKKAFGLIKSINEMGGGGATGACAVGGIGTAGAGADIPGTTGNHGGIGTGNMAFGSTGSSSASTAPGGGFSATSSGSIANFQKRLFDKGKMVVRRKRNFVKLSKFSIPNYKAESFNLLKSMNEDWSHLKDMQFASDVDDSAHANKDIEFNQLRNNVNINNDVTTMDVNKYLDKAHQLNDEVDTVTYGLETDDGSIVKVYVNASQADQFETALADMLGAEDDIEKVINQAAEQFDIVDVEWPESMVKNTDGEVINNEPVTGGNDEGKEANLDLYDEKGNVINDGSEEADGMENGDSEAENSDESDENNEDSEEKNDEENSKRDMFGQIKKESVNTTESILTEARYQNDSLQAISDMMEAMGFNLTSTRSFDYQAKQLLAHNSPGLIAARNNSISQKIKNARDSLNIAMKNSPGETAPNVVPVTQSFELIGNIINESEWIFADKKSMGFTMSSKNLVIKLTKVEISKLLSAFKKGIAVEIHNFDFRPSGHGYKVYEINEEGQPVGKSQILSQEDIEQLIKQLGK